MPPPGASGWESRAVAHLLDIAPAEFRTEPLYQRQPAVLAWRVETLIAHRLDAARTSYARARAELADLVGPEVVAETLAALEREGAHLLAVQREVRLLGWALRDVGPAPRR